MDKGKNKDDKELTTISIQTQERSRILANFDSSQDCTHCGGEVISTMENTDMKTREEYITEIVMRLETNEVFLPTAAQERSYEESLRHVARVISDESNVQPYRCGCGIKNHSRKECLKEVLRELQAMEHKRVYDPPGDSEIGYYLIIRKYIRSLLTFFGSEFQPGGLHKFSVFHEGSCWFSKITGLHHLEELAELCRHLASFSASVSEMDIKSSYTPLMGIEYKQEPPPVILGSRERNSAFYYHKFVLAFLDLRSHSLLFNCPPSTEEKISYLQVLECTPPPTPGTYIVQFSTKVDVYSDYLRYLVIERMIVDINDLEKHCLNIIDAILRKLSLSEPWDGMFKRLYENREAAEAVSSELVQKYDVSIEDIPAYITYVKRGIRLACQTYYFLSGQFHDNERIICFLDNSGYNLQSPSEMAGICVPTLRQGWVVLHALTILNHGSRDEFGEVSILNNPMIQAHLKIEQAGERLEQEENIKRLVGIIEDFSFIGDSDTVPDEEEIQLLNKIWQSVASAVAFFIHAIAYEQQESMIKGYSLFGGTMNFINSAWRPRLKPAEERKKDSTSLRKLLHKMNGLRENLMYFCKFLQAFEKCLLEKLEKCLLEKLETTGKESHQCR